MTLALFNSGSPQEREFWWDDEAGSCPSPLWKIYDLSEILTRKRKRRMKCEFDVGFVRNSGRKLKSVRCLDLVTQLAEHWTSKPKVVGSIPTVVRLSFQLDRCGYRVHNTII